MSPDLNRYMYVRGNPASLTNPSGNGPSAAGNGFGLDRGTAFDCGATFVPFVSSTIDDIADLRRVNRPPAAAVGALDDALAAAYRASENLVDFMVPLKRQPGAGGNCARSGEGVDPNFASSQAVTSDGATFRPNYVNGVRSDTSFRVLTDLGQVVGSNGQTGLSIFVGNDGRIWTAIL